MGKEQETDVYIEEPRRYLIAKVLAPFNKGKILVESAKGGIFRIPAVWLNQQVRQERGYEDDVSKNGNWVLEGVLYRQKADNVFTRIGLTYLHPEEGVSAHLKKREYTLEGCTRDEIDRAVAEGLKINPKDLDVNGNLVIPCSELGSNKYGLWFFGGKGTDEEKSSRAKKSGLRLIDSPQKITQFIVSLDAKKYSKNVGKDYAVQMWFGGLDLRSVLYGGRNWYRDLHFGGSVLGVSDSAEGAAKNSTKK